MVNYEDEAAEAAEMIEADETEGFVMVVAQDPDDQEGMITRTSISASSTAVGTLEDVDYEMLGTALHSVAEGNDVSLKHAAAKMLKSARGHDAHQWE